MKLNKKKQDELKLWEFFIPKSCEFKPKTNRDVEMFFEWSEKGMHREDTEPFIKGQVNTYFQALKMGKKYAGVNMGMWEEGVLEGSTPYATLLGMFDGDKNSWWQFWRKKHKKMPRYVVDFMKKEMFKGQHAEIIENVYQSFK